MYNKIVLNNQLIEDFYKHILLPKGNQNTPRMIDSFAKIRFFRRALYSISTIFKRVDMYNKNVDFKHGR